MTDEKEYPKLKVGRDLSKYTDGINAVFDNMKKSKLAKIFINIKDNHPSTMYAVIFGLPVFTLYLIPFFDGTFDGPTNFLSVFGFTFILAALALTLNVEAGYLGLPNFGKIAFIAVGGYSYAITADILGTDTSPTIVILSGFIVSFIVTALFGVLLTLPTLKLREDYLAITTIVAGEIIRTIFQNEESLGGTNGYSLDDPVLYSYDPQSQMKGYFINYIHFIAIFVVFAIAFYRYYEFSKRDIPHLPNERQKNQGYNKFVFTFIVGIYLLIFMNYKRLFSPDPIFGFDMLLMIFIVMILLYNNLLLKYIQPIYFMLSIPLIAVVDLVIGLSRDVEVTKVIPTYWYFMLMALGVLIFIYWLAEELYFSPFGRSMKSIREDDTSAISVGKSIFNVRLNALIFSSALTGIAAVLYAFFQTTIVPIAFVPSLTFTLYIMMIIGGTGNGKGVIFGTFVVQLLLVVSRGSLVADRLELRDPSSFGLIVVGLTLIFFLIYAPEGIFPEKRYNNQRYYDMLYLNDEKAPLDNPLVARLVELTKSPLESEDWIVSGGKDE